MGSGGFGMAGGGGAKQDTEVTRVDGANDEEIEQKMQGGRLAITIHPQRMVVLQGAFPYRAQIEKFRLALRYQNLEELYRSDDMPTFHGVDVQRQIYGPKGDLLERWHTVNLATETQELRAIKLGYEEDPADLKRVELHEDHMLTMPLPAAYPGAGKYPDMNLPLLKESIAKQKKLDPKSTAPPPPKTRFGGEGNPFHRENAPAAGMYNMPAGMGSGLFGQMRPPGKTGEAPGGTTTQGKWEPPDFVYVRVYDPTVRDGLTYEYRARVKVKNPNFGKKDLVAKASDADLEELPPTEDQWYVFPQKVKVPQAGYFYVIDPLPPSKVYKALRQPNPDKGEALVQFQQWFDYLAAEERGAAEPVGDWVQSELIATRGQFVYGRSFAPVPFWSETENTFVLRDIKDGPVPKGKEPRRGAELTPVKPRYLLAVEVTGGKPTIAQAKVPTNVGEKTNRAGLVDDQSAAEVLFLLPDGSMEVHSSARDRADPDRKAREEHFKKWVEETEKQNPSSTPPPKKGGGIDF